MLLPAKVIVLLLFVTSFIPTTTAFAAIAAVTDSSSTTVRTPSSFVNHLSSSSSTAISQNKNCIIVGGGPIGLAAALTLARPPHSYNVTLLEATSDLTSIYDPSKSYLYNVNPRGLEWFINPMQTAPESAYQQLQLKGYTPQMSSMGTFYIVPANPEQIIPTAKQITTSQQRQTTSSPTSKSDTASTRTTSSPRKPSYWIPRHQLNEILYDCCNEHNNNNNNNANQHDDAAKRTTIQVLSGKVVDHIYPSNEGSNLISVRCNDGNMYTGALIVAADGINSIVRSTLAGLTSTLSTSSWLQSNKESFRVRKYKSPATGLKFKALQFKPNLMIPNSTTTTVDGGDDETLLFTPDSTDIISIRGQNTGFRNRLSLGFLPIKDPKMIRLGNTIAPYDHEIWSLQNGTAAKQWFMKNFPRVKWNECLINDNEWDRYVQTRATTFPFCQYSPGSAVSSPNGLCGVVMVGDSCHAFPPDTGQGVNAGLQDVVALDRALRNVDIVRGTGDNNDDHHHLKASTTTTTTAAVHKLGAALIAYQKNRSPEHAALIRLTRFGAPYQYRQPWLRHRIGAMMWTMNFLFRMIMNKLSFGIIPSTIFTYASNPSFTYRQVMRQADSAAFGFHFIASTFVLRWILLRWSFLLNQTWFVGIPVEASAACLALILLKGILPFKDHLESFLRRERMKSKDDSRIVYNLN